MKLDNFCWIARPDPRSFLFATVGHHLAVGLQVTGCVWSGLLFGGSSTVPRRVDVAKGNCSWGNWQLRAAVQISVETAAAETKAKLNDSHTTAAPSEILERSSNVLTGRDGTSNAVKDAAVATNTFLCYVHVSVGSQHIHESRKVVFTVRFYKGGEINRWHCIDVWARWHGGIMR